MTTNKLLIPVFILLSLAYLPPAMAEDKMNPDKMSTVGAVRCVSLAQIRRMDILDKKHILFDMAGGKQYLNTLPQPCNGLRRDVTIMYRTSLNELCDLDIITVLDNIGGGFMPGASCGLGRFELVDKMRVNELKKEAKKQKN